ncbi:MAG: hypothetical protein V4618_00700 [Pseudomonadota bacterium]
MSNDQSEDCDEDDSPREEISGLSYFIAYSGGTLGSSRRITIRRLQIEGNAIAAVLAFCHERRRLRLFRSDRISEAVDMATGQVFSGPDFCSLLLDRGIPVAEARLVAMIKILVFFARCDGVEHPAEWEAIERAVVRLSRCLIDDDRHVDNLLAYARRLAPDAADFVSALKGLTKTKLPARIHTELRRAIGQVIDADGRHDSAEIAWAVEASNLIARMPTSD